MASDETSILSLGNKVALHIHENGDSRAEPMKLEEFERCKKFWADKAERVLRDALAARPELQLRSANEPDDSRVPEFEEIFNRNEIEVRRG